MIKTDKRMDKNLADYYVGDWDVSNDDDGVDNNKDDEKEEDHDNKDDHYVGDDVGDDDDNEIVCLLCGKDPCEWVQINPLLLRYFSNINNNFATKNNKSKQHFMYKKGSKVKYGFLGRNVRVRLADCIVNKIRQAYPNSDNKYTGFKNR